MILAAGLGTRMRPLTDHTPKPLLQAAGKPLIQYHIERLAEAGIHDLVINTSWLGHQISDYLDNNSCAGSAVQVVHEESPLETAGGIINALPLLTAGNKQALIDGEHAPYFVVVNGDVWTDFDYSELLNIATNIPSTTLAHLVMVDNPPQHPDGDFYLSKHGAISDSAPKSETKAEKLTFSGISLLSAKLFDSCAPGKRALAPLLREAMNKQHVSGHKTNCTWMDIGTPERLQQLEDYILSKLPVS
ncbi:N-acetylmuramate alpha-1-phosphate uridylyltransferase MurU [Alkalimarinus sediminis]